MNLYDCKILLVDDNTELAEMTKGILQKHGYGTVFTAENCGEGMKLFLEESPDLVILDVMLPDGDGFTLFRKMREDSMIPILFYLRKMRTMTDFSDWGSGRTIISQSRFCRRNWCCGWGRF